jgi:hypothetical protein
MRKFLATVAVLAFVGCGGGRDGTMDPGSDGGSGGGGDPDLAPPGYGEYPLGPYGHQQGNTLPNIPLAGYRLTPAQTDSTQLTWDTTIQFADFHKPDCGCLLITIGALWCSACQDEQPALIDDVAADPSFCVLGIVQEGLAQGSTATQANVNTWTQNFYQNFTVVQGTSKTNALLSGFGSTIGLPFNFIVKPQTMQVLDIVQGFDPQIHQYATGLCAQ